MKQGAFFLGAAAGGFVAALLLAQAGFAENKPIPVNEIHVISTDRAPKPVAAFSQAIEANGFIFVAGITPRDPKTGQVVEGDIAAQTERVLENIKAILESAGSSLDRAVKTTVYLKDMDDFDEMGKVYRRYFLSNPPARATVEVSRLHAGRVEIELVAVR